MRGSSFTTMQQLGEWLDRSFAFCEACQRLSATTDKAREAVAQMPEYCHCEAPQYAASARVIEPTNEANEQAN